MSKTGAVIIISVTIAVTILFIFVIFMYYTSNSSDKPHGKIMLYCLEGEKVIYQDSLSTVKDYTIDKNGIISWNGKTRDGIFKGDFFIIKEK